MAPSRNVRHTAFDTAHPAVPALYMGVTLGLTMSSLHPVLVALSLAGALLYGCAARGWREVLAGLRWQLPVVALVALVNPLFVRKGATELFRLFGAPVYVESLTFGLTMGAMLMASVLWFQAAARMVPYDKVTALFGGRMPVVGLMVSMSMRLIPRFVRQGRQVAAVQDVALRSHHERPASLGLRRRLRQSSVLMGWAMEDSLETADAMRARGWGACERRTTYARYRFRARDGVTLAMIAACGAALAVLAWCVLSGFSFYPAPSLLLTPAPLWAYVPYAAWMLAPVVLHVYEEGRFA